MAKRAHTTPKQWQVLIADYQERGKGRFDRSWVAPFGTALATSVLLRPTRPPTQWGWLSLLVGLAISQAIRAHTDPDRVILKWPNDVLVDEKKLCGILCEKIATPSGDAAICGFGINISIRRDELPVPTATSLELCGIHVAREELMADVLNKIAELYMRWDGGEAIAEAYQAGCGTIGRTVRLQLDHDDAAARSVTGVACGIGTCGELVIETDQGIQSFTAGDVAHLRGPGAAR